MPAKLSARVRTLDGGNSLKTDDTDAYTLAVPRMGGRDLEVVCGSTTT